MRIVVEYLIIATMIQMIAGVVNPKLDSREISIVGLTIALTMEPSNIGAIVIASAIIVLAIGQQDHSTILISQIGVIGLEIVGSTTGLLTMYLGIEIVGLSFYILAGRERKGMKSTEAGMKYYVLGALSSGIILMGITIVYATTGTTDLELITSVSRTMIEIGILFKLGAAPFHMWVADVYEGSATIITTYFAVVPKIAYMGFLMKLGGGKELLYIGLVSIIVGSLGAINQTKIKRMLAYSGIGHVGFMILGIGIGSYVSLQATIVYMIIYIVMTINSFTVILSQGIQKIAELRGLSRRNGVLGMTVGISMMSIAGVPPLSGFYNKYLVIMSVVEGSETAVAVIAVIMSVISSYYYIRLIQYMYFKDQAEVTVETVEVGRVKGIILGITTYLILTILIHPGVIMEISIPMIY